jgi:hypothetical protein
MDEIQRKAAEESGLAAEYAGDPTLLEFYARRLLRRGWAGNMMPTEARYVALVHKAQGKYIGVGDRLRAARTESTERARKVVREG